MSKLATIDVPLDSGLFSRLDEEGAVILKSMRERDKFLGGLRSRVSFKTICHVNERGAPFAGTTKYLLMKLVRQGLAGSFFYLEDKTESR